MPPNLSVDIRDGAKHGLVQASFTRPSDTTAYAAGDVIGPVTTPANMSFAGVARLKGGGAILRAVTLHKSDKNTTNAAFDLYLFDTSPAAIADNAEWLPTDAEMLNCIGFVELLAADAHQSGGSSNATGATWCKSNLDLPIVCVSGSTTVYGVLVARGAWTPTSAEVVAVTLHLERD